MALYVINRVIDVRLRSLTSKCVASRLSVLREKPETQRKKLKFSVAVNLVSKLPVLNAKSHILMSQQTLSSEYITGINDVLGVRRLGVMI